MYLLPHAGVPAADSFPTPDVRHYLRAVRAMGRVQPITATRAIFNTQGLKVIDKGVHIDERLYERLMAHKLGAPVQDCLAAGQSTDGAEVAERALSFVQRMPFFAAMAEHDTVRDLLLLALRSVPLPAPIAFSLTLMRETQPEGFDHAVMAALMCAHFSREAGGTQHDMTTAASAGLLHDLGMLYIDPALLRSGRALDPTQRRHLYAHPLTAAAQLQPHHAYPKEVVRAILEHHERLDGAGYPRGLSGDAISPLGRALSLAEVVTAMFTPDRTYPIARLDLLLRLGPQQFDPTLAASVQRLLAGLPRDAMALGGAGPEIPDAQAAQDMQRLREVPRLLEDWRALMQAYQAQAAGRESQLFEQVDELLFVLERTLFDAGVGPDQLERLTEADLRDPVLRVELSLLGREARWQLRMAGLQLRRRWAASSGKAQLPQDLHAWVRTVDVMEAQPVR